MYVQSNFSTSDVLDWYPQTCSSSGSRWQYVLCENVTNQSCLTQMRPPEKKKKEQVTMLQQGVVTEVMRQNSNNYLINWFY